jgi:hypothetical protein
VPVVSRQRTANPENCRSRSKVTLPYDRFDPEF